jgi:putative Mn2+ efflux pump MntP
MMLLNSLFSLEDYQGLMLALGWIGGNTIKSYASAYAQWIASGLLFLIGIKMIYIKKRKTPESLAQGI